MEELLRLEKLVKSGNNSEALLIIDELQEMSLDDKINKIFSYSMILLMYLIKQEAEKRTTRSWETSIAGILSRINTTNRNHQSKTLYVNKETIKETLEDAFSLALLKASLEAFEGQYSSKQLEKLINKNQIIEKSLNLITEKWKQKQ